MKTNSSQLGGSHGSMRKSSALLASGKNTVRVELTPEEADYGKNRAVFGFLPSRGSLRRLSR